MKALRFKRGIIAEVLISLLIVGLLVNCSLLLVSCVSDVRFTGVVYAATGVPVANAKVDAVGENGSGSAYTDSSGAYLINSGLGTGTYNVTATATGYVDLQNTSVQVTVGHKTSGVDFYLSLSGEITGKVTDSVTLAPLQYVLVYAYPSSGGGSIFAYVSSAITDSNGDYTIATNLATGTYNVTVLYPTGHITGTVSDVSVTAGKITSGINLALAESGIISGTITAYPSGAPLANASVSADSSDFKYFGYAISNATGHYSIASGLGTDMYTVTAYCSSDGSYGFNDTLSPVSVAAGSETPNVNMEITVAPPSPSGIITGKVTDSSNGNPIKYALVEADDGIGGYGSAYTDSNGNYVISDGLETGTYNVTASATGYNSTTITGVSVTVNNTTPNINLELNPIPAAQSGGISGTVTGAAGAVPEFATPALLFTTTAAATIALAFIKKRTRKTQ
jgi:protocatechuate 3,4-dioxygenase beta subunit